MIEDINCWFVINFPCKLHWCDFPQPICKIIKWLIIAGRRVFGMDSCNTYAGWLVNIYHWLYSQNFDIGQWIIQKEDTFTLLTIFTWLELIIHFIIWTELFLD